MAVLDETLKISGLGLDILMCQLYAVPAICSASMLTTNIQRIVISMLINLLVDISL